MKPDEATFLFVSKDVGTTKFALPVAHALVNAGCRVTYLLDNTGAAWHEFQKEGALTKQLFEGMDVDSRHPRWIAEPMFYTSVVVTLSVGDGLEQRAVEGAHRFCKPVFGLEDFILGRYNPGWDGVPKTFKRLFTIMPTTHDQAYPVKVVGPVQVMRYAGSCLNHIAVSVAMDMGLPPGTERIIVFFGHPNPESPAALFQVGEALQWLPSVRKGLTLIVARHGRERTAPVPDNAAAYRHVMRLLKSRFGDTVTILDNSPDYADLPPNDPQAIAPEFRPKTVVGYQELVALCSLNGVGVGGFATDPTVVMPHLGLPSLLLLHPLTFGALLLAEKNVTSLPLSLPQQFTRVDEFAAALEVLLTNRQLRQHCYDLLGEAFPFPRDPVGMIQDTLFADLNITP